MKGSRPRLGSYTLFAALGLADLALTYLLLRDHTGQFYESNPLARWWLHRWGWAGLIAFKGILVVLAGAAVAAVSRYRPRIARSVLSFACVATAAVLFYSCTLLAAREPDPRHGPADEAAIWAEGRRLDERIRQTQVYRQRLQEVCADLRTGRCSRAQAVARLAATPKAQDPLWRAELRRLYPGHSHEQSLEATILYHTADPEDVCAPGMPLIAP